jgi:hypothetical protein
VDSDGREPPDPDFQPAVAPPRVAVADDAAPEDYLRILANPFLAFCGFALWLKALIALLGQKTNRDLYGPLAPIIAIVFLAALWGLRSLLQYHCLDCGATGRYVNWREHECLRSLERRYMGAYRRWRGPSPFIQLILWLWALLILGAIVMRYRV